MIRFAEKLLKLRRGDFSRGGLLFAYLFLTISSYVIGKIARDALFLEKFQAVQLPYADIVIALLVGVVVAGYVRLGRKLSFRGLLVGSQLFFISNLVLFWWLAHVLELPWLYPVLYVWVGIYGVLAPAQVWTMANYVLTNREAKRMFGLVGAGAISGWIFGGLFTQWIVRTWGTDSLMLAMAVSLLGCTGLIVLIWRQRREETEEDSKADKTESDAGPQNLRESLGLVWSSQYLRAIALLIFISSFVTTIAGWQFKAIAKATFVQTDALAGFFGEFNTYAGILSLIFQLFLTGRLLRRFGIGPALFVVPVALLAGSAGLLISGTILAAVFLKGSDQILRYSIDKSTVELLYLPISPRVKVQIKSFIDTVVWRMGDGMAGVTLLGVATFLGLSPRSVSWVVLGLLFVWLTAALTAKREYVATLQESIHQRQLDSDRAAAPVLDKSTSELLAANLAEVVSTSPDGLLYALSLYEISPDREANPAVRDLLKHPDPAVRQKAMSVITSTGDPDALQYAEGLLHDSAIEVRTEALLYLAHHHPIDPVTHIESLGDFPDFSIRSGMVAFLAQPGPAQNLEAAQQLLANMVEEGGEGEQRSRLEAARLLGYLPDHFDQQFRQLMEDSDLSISRAAINSAGRLRTRRFVPRLLDLLADSDRETAAAAALAEFGEGIVGTLRDHLTDPSTAKEIRRELPVVLAQIDSPRAVRILIENLLVGDPVLRYEIIAALNKIQQHHPNVQLRAPLIETGLAAEILCTYQFERLLADTHSQQQQETAGFSQLQKLREQGIERIFRLLGLLHPNRDLENAYQGIQSESPSLRDKSLEFLDNILKPQIRSILLPLLDSEVSSPERAQLAKKLISKRMEDYSCKEAITHLVQSENSWLKTCGAFAVGVMGIKSLEPALDTCINHSDPLLCAAARKAKGLLKSVPQAATSFFA